MSRITFLAVIIIAIAVVAAIFTPHFGYQRLDEIRSANLAAADTTDIGDTPDASTGICRPTNLERHRAPQFAVRFPVEADGQAIDGLTRTFHPGDPGEIEIPDDLEPVFADIVGMAHVINSAPVVRDLGQHREGLMILNVPLKGNIEYKFFPTSDGSRCVHLKVKRIDKTLFCPPNKSGSIADIPTAP